MEPSILDIHLRNVPIAWLIAADNGDRWAQKKVLDLLLDRQYVETEEGEMPLREVIVFNRWHIDPEEAVMFFDYGRA